MHNMPAYLYPLRSLSGHPIRVHYVLITSFAGVRKVYVTYESPAKK